MINLLAGFHRCGSSARPVRWCDLVRARCPAKNTALTPVSLRGRIFVRSGGTALRSEKENAPLIEEYLPAFRVEEEYEFRPYSDETRDLREIVRKHRPRIDRRLLQKEP